MRFAFILPGIIGIHLAISGAVRGGPLDDLAKPQEGRSRRATSTMRVGEVRRGGAEQKLNPKAEPRGDLDEASNWDNFRVAPGQTHVLLDEKGPGVITHIWMTFLGPEPQDWAKNGSANHQEMLLRMYWDDRPRPAGRGTSGGLFRQLLRPAPGGHQPAGGGRGRRFLQLLLANAVSEIGPDRNRQPEREADQSALLQHRLDQEKAIPRDTPYFYAQYRQEYPVAHGRDYVVLDTKGKGHYVGTVLAVRTRSPAWFGEGDEKIYLDGEATASIWGTGTEDYFLSAWGLKNVQHALLWGALFRSVGHCGRPHQRLPLAH